MIPATPQEQTDVQGRLRPEEASVPISAAASAVAPIADILDRAADLIEPEGAWTQGRWTADDFSCRCAEGAIAHAANISPLCIGSHPAAIALADVLGLPNAYQGGIALWNDDQSRTQAEVVAALRQAAAAERAKRESPAAPAHSMGTKDGTSEVSSNPEISQ